MAPNKESWDLNEQERGTVDLDLVEAERQAKHASAALVEPTGPAVKLIEYCFAIKAQGKPNRNEPKQINVRLLKIKKLYDSFILRHNTLKIMRGDHKQAGGTRAYTLSTVHDTLYLRDAYFEDPKRELRAATLIHEFAHLFLASDKKAKRHKKYTHPGYDWASRSTPGPPPEPITYEDAVENPGVYEAFAKWVVTIPPPR